MSGRGFIAPEPSDKCEMCGNLEELRPYGPKGERVCFKCGMKDPEAVKRGINEYIFGEGLVN